MKKNRFEKSVIIVLLVCTAAMIIPLAGQERNVERITQDIILQKANSQKDPYTLMYRIKLDEPGMISVLIRKPEGTFHLRNNEALFRIMIGDHRSYNPEKMQIVRKYLKKSTKFGHDRGLVDYSVDNFELGNTGGEYIVYVSSFHQRKAYPVTLIITYPAKKNSEPKPVSLKPVFKPVEVKIMNEEDRE